MKPTILLPETGQTVFTSASGGAALALAVGLGSLAKTLTVSAASSKAMNSFFIFDSHFISPLPRTPSGLHFYKEKLRLFQSISFKVVVNQLLSRQMSALVHNAM